MKSEYFYKMASDERYAEIIENGDTVAMFYFSVCNDPVPFLNNLEHDYIHHNPLGTIVVIEQIVSGKLHFRYIREIENALCSKFPNIQQGMWRRRKFPHDKIYTMKRRCTYAKQY